MDISFDILGKRTLTKEDFVYIHPDMLDILNAYIKEYRVAADQRHKQLWWQEIVCLLPQSYIQERTVMVSYAAIRAMYRQRKGHKLGEWAEFRRWAETLPQAWMITDEEGEK